MLSRLFRESLPLIELCPDLDKNRRENRMVDLNIHTTTNGKLFAHRIVLASRIPSIKQKLARSIGAHMDWKGYPHSVIEKMVIFAYTGEIEITTNDAYQLILCASTLRCAFVADAAAEFIGASITTETINCVWTVAELSNSSCLRTMCLDFLVSNLTVFSLAPVSEQFDINTMQNFIAKAQLQSVADEVQLKAITSWIQSSKGEAKEERIESFPALADNLNWSNISTNLIVDTLKGTSIANYRSFGGVLVKELAERTFGFRRRSSSIVYVVGAKANQSERLFIVRYSPDTQIEEPVGEMPGSDLAKTAFLNGYIYVCGGRNSSSNWKKVFVFDTLNRSVRRVSDLLQSREASHVLTNSTAELFICGGLDGDEWRTCALYDPNANRWKHLPTLNVRRLAAGIAFFEETEGLIVTGGWNGFQREASVEMRTREQPVWFFLAPMLKGRYAHSAVNFRGKVLVAGGDEGHEEGEPSTVELLSPMPDDNGAIGQWTRLADMSRGFKVRSIVVMSSDEVLAFGHAGQVERFRNQIQHKESAQDRDPTNWNWEALPDIHSFTHVCGAHFGSM